MAAGDGPPAAKRRWPTKAARVLVPGVTLDGTVVEGKTSLSGTLSLRKESNIGAETDSVKDSNHGVTEIKEGGGGLLVQSGKLPAAIQPVAGQSKYQVEAAEPAATSDLHRGASKNSDEAFAVQTRVVPASPVVVTEAQASSALDSVSSARALEVMRQHRPSAGQGRVDPAMQAAIRAATAPVTMAGLSPVIHGSTPATMAGLSPVIRGSVPATMAGLSPLPPGPALAETSSVSPVPATMAGLSPLLRGPAPAETSSVSPVPATVVANSSTMLVPPSAHTAGAVIPSVPAAGAMSLPTVSSTVQPTLHAAGATVQPNLRSQRRSNSFPP